MPIRQNLNNIRNQSVLSDAVEFMTWVRKGTCEHLSKLLQESDVEAIDSRRSTLVQTENQLSKGDGIDILGKQRSLLTLPPPR
jgi:hypothetical protein